MVIVEGWASSGGEFVVSRRWRRREGWAPLELVGSRAKRSKGSDAERGFLPSYKPSEPHFPTFLCMLLLSHMTSIERFAPLNWNFFSTCLRELLRVIWRCLGWHVSVIAKVYFKERSTVLSAYTCGVHPTPFCLITSHVMTPSASTEDPECTGPLHE